MIDNKTIMKDMASEPGNEDMVSVESFEQMFSHWKDPLSILDWDCLFVLPVWLKAWWTSFGSGLKPYICAVKHQGQLIGIAPLTVERETARIMFDADLFDHVDLIAARGREKEFFRILFTHLKQNSFTRLELGRLRADSKTVLALEANAQTLGYEFFREPADVLYDMELPHTWEELLSGLSGKDRHEVHRKLRRLERAGLIRFRMVDAKEEVNSAMDTFIRLFRQGRTEKASFMNRDRESFFREVADALAQHHLLKLFFLYINEVPAAAAMCFDHRSTIFLYNSGYEQRFRMLSAGLLCKIFSIRHSINHERKKYDLLKGDETYKRKLGATPVQLYHCWIILKWTGSDLFSTNSQT